MVELTKGTPVKALDGTVQPLGAAPNIILQPRNNGSTEYDLPTRVKQSSTSSTNSVPQPGQILTGKQEHCESSVPPHIRNQPTDPTADLKRELISQQVTYEISELASPTALQRFGAPFRSEYGEVAPVDSDLPILRFIFVHHVRNFPFLDRAREKEFWQDKLQVVREIRHLQRASRALGN